MRKLLLILIIFLHVLGCKKSERKEELEQNVRFLKNQNDSLLNRSKLLQNNFDSIKKEYKLQNDFLYDSDVDGNQFKNKGIRAPKEFVEASLRERTDLIPLKGALGGNMHFGKIKLIGNKWLIAEYEDGHIFGKSIYTYRFKNDKDLEFKLLDSSKY